MTGRPFAPPEGRLLDDGRRLHLQHGPIDLVVEVFGSGSEVAAAYAAAEARFQSVLGELIGELALLRCPITDGARRPAGPVARRMWQACRAHSTAFITPMAAVAGAVADEILGSMRRAARFDKAYVNNGGDIAVHIDAGASLNIGLLPRALATDVGIGLDGTITLKPRDAIGGIATSGARGRSFSLGIADAVTVLAPDAAMADAAATLIANAVDVESPLIERRPAIDLDPDSDLQDRLVTIGVPPLPEVLIGKALDNGWQAAEAMRKSGTIAAVCLALQGAYRFAGVEVKQISSETELLAQAI